jgi:hypothetical protein
LVYSGKGLWCSAFPFTTVEDDSDIAPVLKVPTQLLVPIQTAPGHYEKEHAYVLVGRMVTAGERARHHGNDGNLKRAGWGVNGSLRIRPRPVTG